MTHLVCEALRYANACTVLSSSCIVVGGGDAVVDDEVELDAEVEEDASGVEGAEAWEEADQASSSATRLSACDALLVHTSA